MMDCDNKQALQKLEELRRHKDLLTEEVSGWRCSVQEQSSPHSGTNPAAHTRPVRVKCKFRESFCKQRKTKKIECKIVVTNCETSSPQVKNLTLKTEQETQKRNLTQNDLKALNQQVNALRTSEKQLKQETNHLLDIKQSLEKQNHELRRSASVTAPPSIHHRVCVRS